MAWRTASPASGKAASPISSLPFGKWKYSDPRGGASGVENVVQCGAVIALLAKQLGRCG